METRQHGRITKAVYGKHEDFNVHMMEMTLDFGGSVQGFQSVVVDEDISGPELVKEICTLFHVDSVEKLVGRSCYALRCWPEWNEPIEGFEVDGKRWTQSDFVRRHWPEKWSDRLTQRTETIRNSISHSARRIEEHVQRLAKVGEKYVDWSAPSTSGEEPK